MPAGLSPLDQAHEHANNAKDYYSRGLFIPASAEHYKAASAFKACVDQATDEHAKNTLRKLYDHHSAAGKDLQRRIAKLKEEGKDPSLPQITQTSRAPSRSDSNGKLTPSSSRLRPLDSSSNAFDESFMVLNQNPEQYNEESPFDMFWKVTEEIMTNLAQPMTFQTAALAALVAVEKRSSTTPVQTDDQLGSSSTGRSSTTLKPSNSTSSSSSSGDLLELDEEDYDSSDSFCLIPSTSQPGSTVTKLRKENVRMKEKLEAMETQMASLQKQISHRQEQDQQLRDHIILARKEAQRAIAASTTFNVPGQSMTSIAGLNVSGPPTPSGRDREMQLLRRIRELEEENRTVRVENEKQKAMIAKFRERWEKLKESAKRKKSAKAAAQAELSSVRERIDEDPEAEEAAVAAEALRES